MQLTTGEKFLNYTILDQIGQGGMSNVYQAKDEVTGSTVVIKLPHEALLGDFATFERFQREVEIGRRLDHPHIQKAISSGSDITHPYVIMEYVEGTMLRNLIDKEAPFTVERALTFVLQLCDALAYCHKHGIFHRDLKPENLIVTSDGKLMLMDFGIALLQGARRVTWKRLSAQFGTPDYMSPEQIKGDRGDARSDIYSLGIILYEMLTGEVPYRGDHPLAVMNQHVNGTPRPPAELNPTISPALQEVILKCMRRDPDDRYQDIAEVENALTHLDEVDVPALVAGRAKQPVKLMATTKKTTFWTNLGFEPGTSTIKAGIIVVICIVFLVLVVVLAQTFHQVSR